MAEPNKDPITVAKVDEIRAQIETLCRNVNKSFYEQFNQPMDIIVDYRGTKVKALCKSVFEILLVKYSVIWKSKAIVVDLLSELWCETDLVKETGNAACTVEPVVIRHAILARKAVLQLVPEGPTASSTNIKNTLESKKSTLATLDKSWP